ncbi:MAG: hypothetical protein QOJ19_15 [Acidimicrobiia bacterium]|nr:hypothetical protein [Acidimicrobiia bacterium]
MPPTGAKSDLAGVLRDEEEGRQGINHGREVVGHEVVGHEDGMEADRADRVSLDIQALARGRDVAPTRPRPSSEQQEGEVRRLTQKDLARRLEAGVRPKCVARHSVDVPDVPFKAFAHAEA